MRLLPRLAILILLLVLAWVYRNELFRWQVVTQVESLTGAAAQLDNVLTDLPQGTVELDNLRLTDPQNTSKTLLSVEKITAHSVPHDLRQRFMHLSELRLEGIQVAVDGDGNQLIPDKLWSKFKDRLPNVIAPVDGLDWTAFLRDDPQTVAKNLLSQFGSVKIAEQMRERWPQEVKQIEQLATALKTRFENVKSLAEQTKQPSDKLDLIGAILKELDGADKGVQELIAAIAQLKGKAQTDYEALVAVSRQDQATLKTLAKPNIDTSNIAESLLGPEIREQWNKAVAWGDWARSLLVPVELDNDAAPIYERFGLNPPKRVRGEMIHFAALDSRPELLADTVNLTGRVLFGELPVFFNGVVKNVASPLQLGPEPITAQFCFSGSGIPSSAIPPEDGKELHAEQIPAALDPNLLANLYVTLNIDRIGGNEEDQLILRCPRYQLPARTLGDPSHVAIAVSPGTSKLDGVLQFQGDQIVGQIRIEQHAVQLTPSLPEKLQNSPLHRVLQGTLGDLKEFTVEINVSGTRQQPRYVVKSNIADKLRPSIETLVAQEWETIRGQADAALTGELNQAVATLNSAIQQHLDPLVQEANGQKDLLKQQIAAATGVPLDELIKSQLSRLSPQDQQKIGDVLNSPFVQSLLKSDTPQTPGAPNPIDQLLQKGTDKLQEKLPGFLDKLNRR